MSANAANRVGLVGAIFGYGMSTKGTEAMPVRGLRAPDLVLAMTVRRLREERGVTREVLAVRAGITTGTLARVELGLSSTKWVTVTHIAGALGISLRELALTLEAAEGGREGGGQF
jgi:DNA-binding XRE family transcriptional regulator